MGIKNTVPKGSDGPSTDDKKFSDDSKLDKLLRNVLKEVKHYAENQICHIRKCAQIGLALSSETDINQLLAMIVSQTRTITGADAGSLYTLDRKKKRSHMSILLNIIFRLVNSPVQFLTWMIR